MASHWRLISDVISIERVSACIGFLCLGQVRPGGLGHFFQFRVTFDQLRPFGYTGFRLFPTNDGNASRFSALGSEAIYIKPV